MAAMVVPDAKSAVTGARDSVLGAVTSTATGARVTVTGAVSGVVGLAAGAIQGSVDAVQSVVCTVKESGCMDTVLGKSEEWVDHYLPMTDAELFQLASTVEGFEIPSLQQQKKRRRYYVRLGSLSSPVRDRAHQHSLGKVRKAQASIAEVLSHLQQIFDLVESFNQNIEGGKEKLHHWVDWSRWRTKPRSSTSKCEDQAFDYRVLRMTQMMTIQLQITCLALVSGAQGLPAHIEERVQQLRQNVLDLHTSFSSVRSLGDLSSGILAQSREKATKVNEHLNELLGYVRANTPLTWVVGPFTPSEGGGF